MKITSITVLKADEVAFQARNTAKNRNVETIIENLKNAAHKDIDLVIAGDDMKKFERYALQRGLQKAGAKVTVHVGTHKATNKPVLIIHRLTDKEWKEYQTK